MQLAAIVVVILMAHRVQLRLPRNFAKKEILCVLASEYDIIPRSSSHRSILAENLLALFRVNIAQRGKR
jgi:hypothetical protein